jgi:hypothetical protein
MEVLAKAQTLVVEHAFTISMVLIALVLLAGVAWFSMSRSVTKSPELENKARVNEASTLQAHPPPQESSMPTQEQQEEMARAHSQLESEANSASE